MKIHVETVAEARIFVKTKQIEFGDPNGIRARDILRMVNALDGLEFSCMYCRGSGVKEIGRGREFAWWEDEDGRECDFCQGESVRVHTISEDMSYEMLKEAIDVAVADGVLSYDDNGELVEGDEEAEGRFEEI